MLEFVKNSFSNTSKIQMVLILIFISLLIGATLYVYYTYVAPRMNPNFVANKEFTDVDPYEPDAKIMFFYVNWCPHCKEALPIWHKAKELYHGSKINNRLIYFEEIDCEEDSETADDMKIKGYPTIKLVKGGGEEVIEYDAKPSVKTLEEFLNTVL